jgi:hypothetical protein
VGAGPAGCIGAAYAARLKHNAGPHDSLTTDQDRSALAAIRERGVVQVGLMRVRRGSPQLTSPRDGAHYGYFAAQPVWRYAASLAGSAAICRSAYCYLGCQTSSGCASSHWESDGCSILPSD